MLGGKVQYQINKATEFNKEDLVISQTKTNKEPVNTVLIAIQLGHPS